jgi:probable HAF family extracellular repeat protein
MRRSAARLVAAALVAAALVTTGPGVAPAGAAIVAGAPDSLGLYPEYNGYERWTQDGEAFGINDAGTIVGRVRELNANGVPFVFDPATHTMVRLNPGGFYGVYGSPEAVNEAGTPAGQVWPEDSPLKSAPAVWSIATLSPTTLSTLGGYTGTAHDINDAGIVVGDSPLIDDLVTHAFATHPSTGAVVDIGALPGGSNSTADGVSSAGLVVGTSEVGGTAPCLSEPTAMCPVTHAFTYDVHTGVRTDIGMPPGSLSAEATDISDTGTIVGSSVVPGPGGTATTHPFAYDLATGTFTDLGLASGTVVNRATAVNDDGVVVGDIGGSGGWMFEPGSGPPAAIPGIERLNDINNSGMAVGSGAVLVGEDEPGGPGFVNGAIRVQLTIDPGAPTVLRASSCDGAVTLVWAPPAHTGYEVAPTYRVLRNGAPVATTTATTRRTAGSTGDSFTVQTLNAAGSSPASTALVASCTPSIGGTVTAASGGAAVAGAAVRVYRYPTGGLVAKTATATDGSYSITGLAGGSYLVLTGALGYAIEWNGGATNRADAAAVVVPGGGSVTVDVGLEPSASLVGTVAADGVPVAGVDVRAYVAGTSFAAAKTITGPDGTYGFDRLTAASYQIRFSSPSGSTVVEWNGGVASRSAAPLVEVTADAVVTVDATLALAATVTGGHRSENTWVGSQPPGRAGVNVRVYPVGAPAIAAGLTDTDGRFRLAGLPPGAYQVRLDDPYGRFGGVLWFDVDPIEGVQGAPTRAQAEVYALAGGIVHDIGTIVTW